MISRRLFLQIAATLPMASYATRAIARFSDPDLGHYASRRSFTDHPLDLFTGDQRNLVAQLTETIIPTTDSAGAITAGVPQFIELMVASWMTNDERDNFILGLTTIDPASKKLTGKAFLQASANEKQQILEHLEGLASDHSWYDTGNINKNYEQDAPFICQLKELTVFGYFTSEIGASQALRHSQMPGRFDPDVPLDFDGNSWSPMPEV